MNANHPPLTDAQLEKLSCLEISHTAAAVIRIKADDGRDYLFATAHYVDGIHEAAPLLKRVGHLSV